jgi:cytochrome P450
VRRCDCGHRRSPGCGGCSSRARSPGWLGDPPPDETTFVPFGDGARRCLGEHLARVYVDAIVPAVLEGVRLEPVLPRPERMVLRGTTLVPHRSALMRATAA